MVGWEGEVVGMGGVRMGGVRWWGDGRGEVVGMGGVRWWGWEG